MDILLSFALTPASQLGHISLHIVELGFWNPLKEMKKNPGEPPGETPFFPRNRWVV